MQISRFINFSSLSLLTTIIGVVVAVWIWRADLNSHSLQVRIASQVLLQPDNTGSISGLQVTVDGLPLKSPYLSVLELSNDGDKPVSSGDFEAPLEIRIAEGSVVARAQVTETMPKDIEASLSWNAQELKLKPLLLNPNDILTISVLTSGEKPRFSTRARIAGISAVPVDEDAGTFSRFQKGTLFFLAALLLLVTSAITNDGLLSNEPLLLRRRAAILASVTTGITGGPMFIMFLDTIGVTDISLIVLALVTILFISILLSVYWNWNAKSLYRK